MKNIFLVLSIACMTLACGAEEKDEKTACSCIKELDEIDARMRNGESIGGEFKTKMKECRSLVEPLVDEKGYEGAVESCK